TIIMFTDGVVSAGVRAGVRFMPLAFVEDALRDVTDALTICDRLLSAAVEADSGRPNDDMSVVALTISTAAGEPPVRVQRVILPIP
ncbi:MAG TPA: SpoIIE family protein phosphatase, partial [Thermomicrobiales bacterium]|nr:SpoIIE family protein phosphatase [Thermomicrobiales bacterium]